MENTSIRVMAQAFYGNRVLTDVKTENIDNLILGHLDFSTPSRHKVDRTIVRVPETDNVVIIYNKYQEERNLKHNILETMVMPEENLILHSRCIACRINENDELISLKPEDVEIVNKYFVA